MRQSDVEKRYKKESEVSARKIKSGQHKGSVLIKCVERVFDPEDDNKMIKEAETDTLILDKDTATVIQKLKL